MINQWLENHLLNYTFIEENIFEISNIGKFLVVREKDIVFDERFVLNLDDDEFEEEVDFYCYKFGESFFYIQRDKIDSPEIIPLKYVGIYEGYLGIQSPHLGIHGGFELLNGSGSYKNWLKKAKFLGINTLGIVEKNTLGGVLKFQLTCLDAKIKPIIGLQVVVKDQSDFIQLKCYVKNEEGWKNLLLINKEINVVNNGFIDKNRFLELTEDLVIILDPKYTPHSKSLPYSLNIENLFWQLESVEFENDEKDKEYLLNIKDYLKDSSLQPILINDSYYLDKEDFEAKQILNGISEKRDFKSINQYFKSYEEIFEQLNSLFEEQEDLFNVFEVAIQNLEKVNDSCKFTVKLGEKHLPEYKMTPEQEQSFSSNKEFFLSLIEQGFKERLQLQEEDYDLYFDRIEEEVAVIELGGFIDYFLILWDILEFAKRENILRGIARGSAGGSLVAYLMGITNIDPIPYGLLFERFLNKGRIGKSLPDVDSDFPGSQRDRIKHYMESRYGVEQVCSVGTYTTLKMKAALKDLGRKYGVDTFSMNYLTKILDDDNLTFSSLFKLAYTNTSLKKFILDHSDLIQDLPLILNQPRSKSIHACAMLILPQEKNVFEWIPIRKETKNDETLLVTEWEGGELEAAGFLKEDILGIKQLDKLSLIIDLIKQNTGTLIDIYSLPLDDLEVYNTFQRGENGDIFHFGSKGLTNYCRELLPENINDLIAGIALYRPGAMENNFHNEYILRKNGERPVDYPWGTEEITKETYGLYCFQEQIMRTCSDVGGFSLIEADDIRKAMGKKKQDLLNSYKTKFVEGAIKKGCPRDEAEDLWEKLEKFGTYGFNKSHAAAYAITGYICQWIKVHYPMEFWTVAFGQADSEEDLSRYISEINDTKSTIKVSGPDINKSQIDFSTDYKTGRLLWSVSRIKQCGEEATKVILLEREEKGEFFSLSEFLERVPKTKVNKRVVENLIISGAFDFLEGITSPVDRYNLIKLFRKDRSIKEKATDDELFSKNQDKLKYDWWWTLQQKLITGYGYFDYKKLIQRSSFNTSNYSILKSSSMDDDLNGERQKIVFGGFVVEVNVRSSKKGEFAQVLIEHNYKSIWVIFWSEIWKTYKASIEESKGSILLVSGSLTFDSWRKQNIIQTEEWTEIEILK